MGYRWICSLALVLLVSAAGVAQDSTTEVPPTTASAPPAVPEGSFDDLYPDVDLPDAANAAEEPTPAPARGGPPPSPSEIPGQASRPAPESMSELDFSGLYPDVELPGVRPLAGAPEHDPRGAEEVPAVVAPANDRADDPFADLYPDADLPGSKETVAADPAPAASDPGGGTIDLSPPAETPPGELQGPDATLIDELLGDAAQRRRTEAEEAPVVLQSPRELLEMFDPPIDDSQLRSFVDREPVSGADEETLTRILYRLPRFSLVQIQRWENIQPNWEELLEEPDLFRAEFFRARGRVRRIERVGVIPEIVERLQFEHYYRVHIVLEDSPFLAIACTRNIPNAWIRAHNEDRALNERAGFSGMFLKVGGEQDGKRELVFATRRVAWYPDRPDENLGISEDQVLLGNLQMDVGLLELLKDRSQIGPSDREGFYQMLSAMGNTTREDLDQRAAPTHDIVAMLTEPSSQRGRLMTIQGNARRVIKLRVEDPDIRERFGITHYYELAVFVPLKARIDFSVGEGQPPKRFDNSFPMIFCVRNLPEGMPRGPDIRESVTVRIPAYYFKLYSYRSQYMSAGGGTGRQISPLLIGLEPEWIEPSQHTNPWLSLLLGSLFIVAVAGIWVGLWLYSKSDRQFERETLAKQFQLAEGKSLNDMGIEASTGPDFRGLGSASNGSESGSDPDDRGVGS